MSCLLSRFVRSGKPDRPPDTLSTGATRGYFRDYFRDYFQVNLHPSAARIRTEADPATAGRRRSGARFGAIASLGQAAVAPQSGYKSNNGPPELFNCTSIP